MTTNPPITVVITDMKNSNKQLDIGRWLNFEMSSSFLSWKAFSFYNPDYPARTHRDVSFFENKPLRISPQ